MVFMHVYLEDSDLFHSRFLSIGVVWLCNAIVSLASCQWLQWTLRQEWEQSRDYGGEQAIGKEEWWTTIKRVFNVKGLWGSENPQACISEFYRNSQWTSYRNRIERREAWPNELSQWLIFMFSHMEWYKVPCLCRSV